MTTTEPTAADAPAPDPNEVRLTINGREVVSRKGELLIEAAARAGDYIPRFCYHERMKPVGMCRMCIVEADTGRGPALTVSCMVPVAPGMVVNTESPMTKDVQEGVLEMLLANHPLDCPVCDKGGECPLQDQAYSHGPGESRFVEEKRHYEKPIAISDLVLLDRERCILCDRCTRFADTVAGDKLISFADRGNGTQISTFPDEPFSSYFSGNTVQICPVGALTAKPYRFKARPWDLSEAESTCTTCASGCRTVVQSSRDQVLRYQGVDSDPVNWGWLCDRGRFSFESINSDARLEAPLVRRGDDLVPTSWNAALDAAAEAIKDAIAAGGPASVAVLGGARGTNEDAYAWAQLAHEVIGTPHASPQFGDGLPAAVLGLPRATIDDVAGATTVILLSPDLKEELPILYLRLRDAADKRRSRIVEFAPKTTGMTPYAWRTFPYQPGTQPAVVRAALADPAVRDQVARGTVAVVFGRANLAETNDAALAALHEVLQAAPAAKVLPAFRRGNVVGALQLGLGPVAGGDDGHDILRAAADGKVECLVLLGADPLGSCPDTDLARRALAGARRLIAVDTVLNESSKLASVVLAASAYAEKAGTTTNVEGRVSTVAQKVTARGTTRADWMVAVELADLLGADLGFTSVEAITAEIAREVPAYAAATPAALAREVDGVVVGRPTGVAAPVAADVTAAERNSYDFRLVVSRTMYDQAVGTATSPSLAPLAPGASAHLHPLDLDRVGTTAGAMVTLTSTKGSIVLTAEPDPAVLRGTVWVPFAQPGANVGELIDIDAPITDVRIETI
jgi:NADH-quinone oxidoreductase subunit G